MVIDTAMRYQEMQWLTAIYFETCRRIFADCLSMYAENNSALELQSDVITHNATATWLEDKESLDSNIAIQHILHSAQEQDTPNSPARKASKTLLGVKHILPGPSIVGETHTSQLLQRGCELLRNRT